MDTVNLEGNQSTTVGDRLREERVRFNLNQTDFAALGGVGKLAQINYESGKRSPDSDYLSAVAQHGVDVLFVLTGQRSSGDAGEKFRLSRATADYELGRLLDQAGEPSEKDLAEIQRIFGELKQARRSDEPTRPVLDAAGFAAIPVHDASVGAGPGRENSAEAVVDHLAFRRDWLRRIGVAPDQAVIARVSGDSMIPTINDGDVVLIDTARSAPPIRPRDPKDTRPPPIYAVVDDGIARVKRLEFATKGVLALLSDNPSSPPDFRPVDRVTIIGKVLWWGHTNRE